MEKWERQKVSHSEHENVARVIQRIGQVSDICNNFSDRGLQLRPTNSFDDVIVGFLSKKEDPLHSVLTQYAISYLSGKDPEFDVSLQHYTQIAPQTIGFALTRLGLSPEAKATDLQEFIYGRVAQVVPGEKLVVLNAFLDRLYSSSGSEDINSAVGYIRERIIVGDYFLINWVFHDYRLFKDDKGGGYVPAIERLINAIGDDYINPLIRVHQDESNLEQLNAMIHLVYFYGTNGAHMRFLLESTYNNIHKAIVANNLLTDATKRNILERLFAVQVDYWEYKDAVIEQLALAGETDQMCEEDPFLWEGNIFQDYYTTSSYKPDVFDLVLSKIPVSADIIRALSRKPMILEDITPGTMINEAVAFLIRDKIYLLFLSNSNKYVEVALPIDPNQADIQGIPILRNSRGEFLNPARIRNMLVPSINDCLPKDQPPDTNSGTTRRGKQKKHKMTNSKQVVSSDEEKKQRALAQLHRHYMSVEARAAQKSQRQDREETSDEEEVVSSYTVSIASILGIDDIKWGADESAHIEAIISHVTANSFEIEEWNTYKSYHQKLAIALYESVINANNGSKIPEGYSGPLRAYDKCVVQNIPPGTNWRIIFMIYRGIYIPLGMYKRADLYKTATLTAFVKKINQKREEVIARIQGIN